MTTFSPTVLLRAEQTADQVAVIDNRVPAHWGGLRDPVVGRSRRV